MWILREIERHGGEVGFRRFMELALYHPEHGYYMRARRPWGPGGDYLTAPTASIWYAATVAGFVEELSRSHGGRLNLVDLAAGDGSFLATVLESLGTAAGKVVERVRAVELSPTRRAEAAAALADREVVVEITGGADESIPSPAVVHASELYDAMPVHRVEQTERGLMEITVVVEGGGLGWGRRPARPRLADYFASHGLTLAVGQMAEINLQAEPHHRRLLDRLPAGVVLVLDYGYPAERLYDGRGRRFGSLATYRRHELGADPLDAPGERDLTAHVNFDDLRRAGTSCGWCDLGLMPLAEFLVRAGLGRRLDERGFGIDAALDADTVAARQEVKRLLDPEGMGSDLKMLVQGRGKIGEIAAEILGRDP